MRFAAFFPLLCLLVFSLGGCATPEQERRDRLYELRTHGVTGPVYGRVARVERLSIDEILYLVRRGVDDDTIIDHIDETNAVYRPSEKELDRLYRGGASLKLIEYIVASGGGSLAPHGGAALYTETYVVGGYPYSYYPGPYFHGGYYGGYYRHHHHYHHRGRHHHHHRHYDRPRYPHERIQDRFRRRF